MVKGYCTFRVEVANVAERMFLVNRHILQKRSRPEKSMKSDTVISQHALPNRFFTSAETYL